MKYLYTALVFAFICESGTVAQEKKAAFLTRLKVHSLQR